jgi:uncharacterized damage-inducible protein DinB
MSVRTISECITRSVSGDPWHGPSLEALLADVTPEEAAAHPIPGAHSIVEIVRHLAAWFEEVGSRLQGHAPGDPAEGDWPPTCPWAEAHSKLAAAHAGLQRTLAGTKDTQLGDRVGAVRDAPLGTGVTFETMLVGLAEHDTYHAVQIALLKRALRGRS